MLLNFALLSLIILLQHFQAINSYTVSKAVSYQVTEYEL